MPLPSAFRLLRLRLRLRSEVRSSLAFARKPQTSYVPVSWVAFRHSPGIIPREGLLLSY
jgi:hypothetical protein